MKQQSSISQDYPYESKYVNVLGSKIHYLDEGEGDPVIFIHGIPTWSYLWRNIIPPVCQHARCLALDLIGCGKSDKPDIPYSVMDHIQYLEGFIDSLTLKNVTLVMHGWGSVVGLDYAMRHQENVKALAMLESHLRAPTMREMLSLPVQELTSLLDQEDGGYDVIMNSNYYVNKVLQSGVLRKLSQIEMENYQTPFKENKSNTPIWQYLQELPRGNNVTPATNIIQQYSERLQQSSIPKLLLYAMPGFITTMESLQWAKESMPNVSLVDIGEAIHYAQETKPDVIGDAIRDWYVSIK